MERVKFESRNIFLNALATQLVHSLFSRHVNSIVLLSSSRHSLEAAKLERNECITISRPRTFTGIITFTF